MDMTRREALSGGAVGIAALLGTGLFAGGCDKTRNPMRAPLPASLKLPNRESGRIARVVNRVGFGPSPGQIGLVARMGLDAWLEAQLRADAHEDANLRIRVSRLPVYHLPAGELANYPEAAVLAMLQQGAILRMVYSPNQLFERMVDFWTNHFNVYARKGRAAFRKGADEVEVIRRHALGSFPAMLRASAKSPAMLVYLDNQANTAAGPNENYARELLELHTLGIDGGYTQKDVVEVARCLTGWTTERGFLRPTGTVKFEPGLHDDGEKIVLGHRIPPGGGATDIDRVLDILVEHPSTGRHLARKLCHHFLGEAGDAIRPQVARAYQASRGDIREMLRPILGAPALTAGPPILKRPIDFLVSALRALDADTNGGREIQRHLDRMGQPLYQWPMPDGYPDHTGAWTGSLLARWNFAYSLAKGTIPRTSVRLEPLVGELGAPRVAALMALILGLGPEDDRVLASQISNLGDGPDALAVGAAVCLASPAFQWR